MFELLHAFTTKLDALRFGMTDFNTATDASGNEASEWNYGDNFGGHASSVSAGSSFTPYATMHHAADATGGMFGKWAVDMPENLPTLDLHPCETMFAHADGKDLGYSNVDVCKEKFAMGKHMGGDYMKHVRKVNAYNEARANGEDHTSAYDFAIEAEKTLKNSNTTGPGARGGHNVVTWGA